jgi:hypothetical protein
MRSIEAVAIRIAPPWAWRKTLRHGHGSGARTAAAAGAGKQPNYGFGHHLEFLLLMAGVALLTRLPARGQPERL